MLQRALLAILASVLATAILLLGVLPNARAVPTDYAQFYFAGQLVAKGEVARIYDVAAYEPLTAAVRSKGFDVIPSHFFNRPAFAALLCYPLAFFSFKTSSNILVVLNVLLWALLVWKLPLWLGAPQEVRWWLLSFLPFAVTVSQMQDTMLITLLMVYACAVLMPQRQIAAGVVLSLCLLKPHLMLLVPLLFVVERKWAALRSFLASGALLGLLSFSLVGTDGVRQWFVLLGSPTTDVIAPAMGNLRAIGLNFGFPVATALSITALFAGAAIVKYGTYKDRFAVLTVLSLLVSPHTYWQDYSLVVIFALVTGVPLIRYSILLPWAVFGPSDPTLAVWPTTLVLIACVVVRAISLTPKSLFQLVQEALLQKSS